MVPSEPARTHVSLDGLRDAFGALAKEGEKVAAETKLKDAKKSLKTLELEEKQTGQPQAQKKAELTKLTAKLENDVATVKASISEDDNKSEEKKEGGKGKE